MNILEVSQILLLASGFTPFVAVNEVTTQAWHLALSGVEYEAAKAATVEHFTGPNAGDNFGVHHIRAIVNRTGRTSVAAIEADVRSAKARGMIGREWPDGKQLPPAMLERLSRARAGEQATARHLAALDISDGVQANLGQIGRRA